MGFSVFVAIYSFFYIRNFGAYPTVLADEWAYSLYTRLAPVKDAAIPDFFFFFVYKLTSVCGVKFLNCARFLNILFFVLAAPFIYLIARKFCNNFLSCFITLLAALSPNNIYTIHFMPESLYFLFFWIVSYFVLNIYTKKIFKGDLIIALLIAICSLIKPHALFLLPSILIFRIAKNHASFRSSVFLIFLTVIIKFIIGYLIAGKSGLVFFGPVYSSFKPNHLFDISALFHFISISIEILKNHLALIFIIYCFPFLVMINYLPCSFSYKSLSLSRIILYTFLIITSLIFTTSLFSSLVQNAGPYESIFRVHSRYYNFALPLFLIISASQINIVQLNSDFKKIKKIIIAVPIIIVISYFITLGSNPVKLFYEEMSHHISLLADSPELLTLISESTTLLFFGLFSIFIIILWIWYEKLSNKLFLFLFFPLFVLKSNYYIYGQIQLSKLPTIYEVAAIDVKNYLPKKELSKLMVIGSNTEVYGLFKILFQLDNKDVSIEELNFNADYDTSHTPLNKKWILVIGKHKVTGTSEVEINGNGYTLLKIKH